MAIEDFNHIKDVLSTLDLKRPSRFAYTQEALDATGAAEITALTGIYALEDSSQINSIPDPVQVAMDSVVVSVGLRTQAATLSRLMVNHFFGRFSLNMVKLTEKIKLLVSDHLVNRYITTSGKIVENIGVTPQATTVDLVQNRSPLAAQVPTTETLTVSIPAAVHSGNAGVMTGADKAVLDNIISAGLPGKQPLDSDLTAIAGLTPANDDVIQRISGSWVNRTMAQLKTSLGLNNVTNESKATMFTNPTFTGTPTGVTKAHVGLGNVDNQSKATMFTSPVFTGNIPELPAVNPTTGNQAARKSYVDTADAAAVKLTGDQTVAGKKTFSTIPELPASDPTTANQAARKKYVDDVVAGASVIPMSYLDTDPTMAANSDVKVASQKAVKNNFDFTQLNFILLGFKGVDLLGSLTAGCQYCMDIGGDCTVFGATGTAIWRSIDGGIPTNITITGSTGHVDQYGNILWSGVGDKWFFCLRNDGLYVTNDIKASSPVFTRQYVGGDYRSMVKEYEGETVIYAFDTVSNSVVKFTNNGTTMTTIRVSGVANASHFYKHGSVLINGSFIALEYSTNNGVNWYPSSIALVGGRSIQRITYGMGYFYCVATYASLNPMIYRSVDGAVWTLIYTGSLASHSTVGNLMCLEDSVFVWTEGGSTSSGFRIMTSFKSDLSVLEPPTIYTCPVYPQLFKIFKGSLFMTSGSTTPSLYRSPVLFNAKSYS